MVTVVLGLLLVVFQAYVILYLAYLWAPALAAMEANRRKTADLDTPGGRKRSFAILVSAHNEEAVIGALLRSLAVQQYPAEKRRVYVVANNCTDATATVVDDSRAAICHQRSTGGLATKGAALAWLWERVEGEVSDCDCVLILDADNLVAPSFLEEMNRVFEKGCRVVQSTRCAKNADESWTSQLDAISEALWNRLDQSGRMHLGLSATLAGSGMAFQLSVFQWLIGGGAPGLLEDIEWQARLMLENIPVGYAEGAKVYDEKTRRAGQLTRQRKRWVAGIAIAGRRYALPLLVSGVRSGNVQQMVAGFGASKPPRSLWLALMGLLAGIGWFISSAPCLLPWFFWVGALGSFALYVLLGMVLDRARPQAYLALLLAPVFALLMIGASLAAGLRPSKQRWIPTVHGQGSAVDGVQME